MLLSSIFTFRAGPVLQLDPLSHFLTFVWDKIEALVNMFFRICMQKLLCHTDLTDDPLIFCRTICGSANSSELEITAPG